MVGGNMRTNELLTVAFEGKSESALARRLFALHVVVGFSRLPPFNDICDLGLAVFVWEVDRHAVYGSFGTLVCVSCLDHTSRALIRNSVSIENGRGVFVLFAGMEYTCICENNNNNSCDIEDYVENRICLLSVILLSKACKCRCNAEFSDQPESRHKANTRNINFVYAAYTCVFTYMSSTMGAQDHVKTRVFDITCWCTADILMMVLLPYWTAATVADAV